VGDFSPLMTSGSVPAPVLICVQSLNKQTANLCTGGGTYWKILLEQRRSARRTGLNCSAQLKILKAHDSHLFRRTLSVV